ncbi:hypothetical protein [Planomonospora venezuelensis]|uniref:Tail assembly chaperone n=1 Tax=Planomonospora venezuelensis TaxID=1999 RepID=A0A841D470_PLAVE|nr:hypothetical protein [Planomonospora venezuelensis]MBB5965051.1 hypothetical protein [Planomonospora venezuelensis]GIN05032.1 hypothetical protein Pve01_66900 [Planomonospora venezuelensis]
MTTNAPSPEHDDDLDETEVEQDQHESWDAFWAEIQRQEAAERGESATETIRGVQVVVPHDLPLRFDRRLEQVRDSSAIGDITGLIVELFGADVLDAWVDAGMTAMEFRVVVAWGLARGRGRDLSFRDAYELVKNNSEGKAPGKGTRRSGGSGGSGQRSKRTSGGSTASRRRASRT